MIANLDASLARLIAKDAIAEVINRYCRGVDIPDLETIKSAYWPDATDDHLVFSGNAMAFVEMAIGVLQTYRASLHYCTNLSVRMIDDDHADAESYYYVRHELPPEPGGGPIMTTLSGGRYLDRFERRRGEWRILARKVTQDWNERRPLDDPARRPFAKAG